MIKNKVRLNHDLPMGELLDTAINELRAMARSLHQIQLQKLGLAKVIKLLLNQIDRETELFVSSQIDELENSSDKITELQIYRIFQESINNILKHAEASAIQVSLRHSKTEIELIVSDNGKGFDFSEKYNDFQSLGLKTPKERTAAIQGTMKVTSEKGNGTVLSFSVNV
jgi:signal transduction histidine kinase